MNVQDCAALARWRTIAPALALAIALACGACTLSPRNGELLESTDEPLIFSGYAGAAAQPVHVQVQDCSTGEWRTVASGHSSEDQVLACGERLYAWEIANVNLPQSYDAWCESYGVLWIYARVLDGEGSPLPSFGRPWQDGCGIESLCDPEQRRECMNPDGGIMLLCTRGKSAGCTDRLR